MHMYSVSDVGVSHTDQISQSPVLVTIASRYQGMRLMQLSLFTFILAPWAILGKIHYVFVSNQ